MVYSIEVIASLNGKPAPHYPSPLCKFQIDLIRVISPRGHVGKHVLDYFSLYLRLSRCLFPAVVNFQLAHCCQPVHPRCNRDRMRGSRT